MNWIRLTLIAQLLFFVGWGGLEEYRKVDAQEFLLETRPVDPRDFLSGHYMILRYAKLKPNFGKHKPRGKVWVKLHQADEVTVNGKVWPLWRAEGTWVGLKPSRMLNREWGWAAGQRKNREMAFGIERYYFSEKRKKDLNSLRGGRFYVHASLAPDGSLRVLDLVFEEK